MKVTIDFSLSFAAVTFHLRSETRRMSGQVDINALASSLSNNGPQRDKLFQSMEGAVKEIVNFLLPSDHLLQQMERTLEPVAGAGAEKVAIRRDELESVIHLVSSAHVLSSRLRTIFALAANGGGAPQTAPEVEAPVAVQPEAPRPLEDVSLREDARAREEARLRDEARLREETRARDEARAREELRARDESWRRELREPLRPIKAA
ncbi:hypothetical protein ACFQI3_05605 [Hansschlegelia quercus]|uniref:Uncharacterized protein n=1 Tax=Hansschlegelia quercus TaxID=2528245 RepID=A0A4Q9GIC5_9HYPH|nr:hypothetical protein [Hansschlegelia quercus]TBN53953.1 hypothetical protein EYR15_09240 [Hansschlegelia quercus]